jgi:hypothetical protein
VAQVQAMQQPVSTMRGQEGDATRGRQEMMAQQPAGATRQREAARRDNETTRGRRVERRCNNQPAQREDERVARGVCVCSGNPVPGGSCNHAIPIATSPPRESPPHLCHPVVLPLRSPWGAFRRGFQRVPRSLDSVTRSDVTTWAMSHQVFIAGTACISGEGQQPPL